MHACLKLISIHISYYLHFMLVSLVKHFLPKISMLILEAKIIMEMKNSIFPWISL